MHIQHRSKSDATTFRKTLGHFASGVTVITTAYEGSVHGMTANAFCSVSLDPPLVLVSVDKRSHMHARLMQSNRYGVSVLARNQEHFSRHFAGRSQVGLEIPFVWHGDCPLIAGSVVQLVCQVVAVHSAGDHTLYIGQVEFLGYSNESAPLLFYAGTYRALDVQIRDYDYLFPYEHSWW